MDLDFSSLYPIMESFYVVSQGDLYTISGIADFDVSEFENKVESEEVDDPVLYFRGTLFELEEASYNLEDEIERFLLKNKERIKDSLSGKVEPYSQDTVSSLETLRDVEEYDDLKCIWEVIDPIVEEGISDVLGESYGKEELNLGFKEIKDELSKRLPKMMPDSVFYERGIWKFRDGSSDPKLILPSKQDHPKTEICMSDKIASFDYVKTETFEQNVESRVLDLVEEKAEEIEESLQLDIDERIAKLNECDKKPYSVSYSKGEETHEIKYYRVEEGYYYILNEKDSYPMFCPDKDHNYKFEGYTAAVPLKIDDKGGARIKSEYNNSSKFIGLVILGPYYSEEGEGVDLGGKKYINPYVGDQHKKGTGDDDKGRELVPCLREPGTDDYLNNVAEDLYNNLNRFDEDRVKHLLFTGTRALEAAPAPGQTPRYSLSNCERIAPDFDEEEELSAVEIFEGQVKSEGIEDMRF